MQIPRKTEGKFAVGDCVRILQGYRGAIGEVVENRGNIGVNARRLYGVKFRMDEWNEMTTEFPEENLEPVEDAKPSANCKSK